MNDGIVRRYWTCYGGWKALFTSTYFWLSIIISAALYPAWTNPGWWDTVLSIMPNLLGFSLGGYAMWMSIGDDKFKKMISGPEADGSPSPYMEVNATFVHFIILQILSLLCALFAKTYYFKLPTNHPILEFFGENFGVAVACGYYISYLVFIYAILSAVAATFALLRISSWYDMDQDNENDPE
jgi:hypothetical protein